MHSMPAVIAAVFVIALLGVQQSGMHMHVNLQGDSGTLHGSHVHHADPDGHDHSGDVDVSVLDLGTVLAKLLTFLLPASAWLLSVVWILQSAWPPPRLLQAAQRKSHWRPPLRAPPHPA